MTSNPLLDQALEEISSLPPSPAPWTLTPSAWTPTGEEIHIETRDCACGVASRFLVEVFRVETYTGTRPGGEAPRRLLPIGKPSGRYPLSRVSTIKSVHLCGYCV